MSRPGTELAQQVNGYGRPLVQTPFYPTQPMINDVDGDGYAFSGLGGCQVGYKTTKEICLGIRTGGKTGCGSWDDPYHAATATLLDGYLNSLDPAFHWIVRLRDGIFYTNGIAPVPYLTLLGAGMDATRILLDPATDFAAIGGAQFAVIGTVYGAAQRYFDGFTVDTNFANLQHLITASKIVPLGVEGANQIRNIRARGTYGDIDSGEEAWAIIITLATAGEAHIEYCIAEDFHGNYVNGITIAHTYPTLASKAGTVSRCKVSGAWVPTNLGHGVAYGNDGGLIDACYSDHCTTAVYFEFGNRLTISNCHFLDCGQTGISCQSAAGPNGPATLFNNEIEIRDDQPEASGAAIVFSNDPAVTAHRWHNCKTIANTCRKKVTGNTPFASPPRAYIDAHPGGAITGLGNQVIGNNFDALLANYCQPDTLCIGNRGLNGELLSGAKYVNTDTPGVGLPDDFITQGAARAVIGDTDADDGTSVLVAGGTVLIKDPDTGTGMLKLGDTTITKAPGSPIVDLGTGLKVGNNLEVVGAASGLVLESPNHSRWITQVNNSGVLVTSAAP